MTHDSRASWSIFDICPDLIRSNTNHAVIKVGHGIALTSCGRISLLTTASASSSLWFARRPSATAADCWMLRAGGRHVSLAAERDNSPRGKETRDARLGTLSSSSGLRRAITPACCSTSMFCSTLGALVRDAPRCEDAASRSAELRTCGLVASSATVCTKVTRSFWYFSNTCSTARVLDLRESESHGIRVLRAQSARQHRR